MDNKRILENLKNAYEKWPDKKFIARTPLIPGVNDSEDDIRFGQSKYEFLGRNYELADFQTAPAEVVARLRAIVDEAFGRKGWSEVNSPLQLPEEDSK